MKRNHSIKRMFLLYISSIFSLLFLVACQDKVTVSNDNLVYIVESDFFTVENNGVMVNSNKNVRFTITPKTGYSITGTDYEGPYRIWQSGSQTIVELVSISYPTRVELKLSSKYRTITYDANGGNASDGSSACFTATYDLTNHLRPNTSNGVGIFSRKGYTLESWNTKADGSGERIGLGSRVSVDINGLTLYAQWVKWTEASAFSYISDENGITITGCSSNDSLIIIPQEIDDKPVVCIASAAFKDKISTETLILSPSLQSIENGAFENCKLSKIVLYDNIESFGDASFGNCQTGTLYINAVEAPYGYEYRRESMYADKIDLLIESKGKKKMVFYSGCSVWYNLDSESIKNAFGSDYQIVNLGLNGTVNSWVQMAILTEYIEEGDLLIHTPELSSSRQLMISLDMNDQDNMLWCGIENNYDLFALVDISEINGVFDSLSYYLSQKNKEATYDDQRYTSDGFPYIDDIGCIPFSRTETSEKLLDTVNLNVEKMQAYSFENLQRCYTVLSKKGVEIFVSYAVVNIDNVPEEQQGNIASIGSVFSEKIEALDGPVLISNIWDFIYHSNDFYDTNYHLLSKQAVDNTAVWIRDIKLQLEK